jgi:UDP-N-acetylglucosamine 2-epimerase
MKRGRRFAGRRSVETSEHAALAKIQVVLGTRPEVIKMAPVIHALRQHRAAFDVELIAVGQQRDLLDRALDEWALRPNHRVDLATHGQELSHHVAAILAAVGPIVGAGRADIVLVHGDTSTAFAAALAAFYAGAPIGHVEAGLRTGDLGAPFPEEMHRVVIDRMATVLYAPTPRARDHLRREGYPDASIVVVGNTVIDALRDTSGHLGARRSPDSRRLLVVTSHRRENFGNGVHGICTALASLLRRRDDVQVVYVLHPNPAAHGPVRALLGGLSAAFLCEPLEHAEFIGLLRRAHIVLTDSGGVQEEAAALGIPVLVLRERTERYESVADGVSRVVHTDADNIVHAIEELLDDGVLHASMSRGTAAYGDGFASERIANDLASRLGVSACA